ncbi:pentatricopeptide repeat-containing protein [Pyrus ussuriensis x Pyrus communis]|uniref:Pentatricopeptide repeat-containing protein n=1 Tax=Pyrus ussuriensis x Pyrus communis TaxID=2448454 RepID=A0A5N5G886_9ROSA|nr:pentatricopeptide repeat-containing protein [Pyrus ussuriensis x Pyrus communis]
MALRAANARLCRCLPPLHCRVLQHRSNHLISSSELLQETIRNTVESRATRKYLILSFPLPKHAKTPILSHSFRPIPTTLNTDLIGNAFNWISSRLWSVQLPDIFFVFCDQLNEAVKLLKGMSRVGCIPDLESFYIVIGAMCTDRRTAEAVDMIKMVEKFGLTPRQGTVMKVAAALRANKEIWRAVEMIGFLEREGYPVSCESYELVVKGCLDAGEYILAGKVVIRMTEGGFIPYIRTRLKVVERLAGAGEWELACSVRQRFGELKS